jgi:hypothetical protein
MVSQLRRVLLTTHLRPVTAELGEIFRHGARFCRPSPLAERHLEAVRQQGGMFVEAVRVTRMPMLVTDPTLPGNSSSPIGPSLTLSGYAEEEVLGQDPHFMNGGQTDLASIRQYEAAIEDRRDETLELLQYRNGAPFRAMLFASPIG